jgi:hypothetical protein
VTCAAWKADRSSGGRMIQQIDKVNGLPLSVFESIDADE